MQPSQFIHKQNNHQSHSLPFATIIISILLFLSCTHTPTKLTRSTTDWTTTWAAAPYLVEPHNKPPAPGLTGNSLRQVVRVSIGGETLRMKFSNIASPNAIVLNMVTIAESTDGKDTIDTSTLKELKFNSNYSVLINAYSSVMSDPVQFKLKPGMKLAITIYYGETSADITGHVGSRTDSYLLADNRTHAENFSGSVKTMHWYTINSIDVPATESSAAVAVFGDSITDGYGLTDGKQNRWTDALSVSLLGNPETQHIGVLNMGIGATHVLSGRNSGISRYKQDILDQPSVRWVIIFYGVNDICAASASAEDLINAYKKFIADGHAKGIKVYGATITPFKGHPYYTPAHEAVRLGVNEWIRTSKVFDAVIDFDKTIRDPDDQAKFRKELQNDWLHPNAQGYKVMGESVDTELFTE